MYTLDHHDDCFDSAACSLVDHAGLVREGVMVLQSTTAGNGRTMTVPGPGSAYDCADPWESSVNTMGLSDGPHHHHIPPALLCGAAWSRVADIATSLSTQQGRNSALQRALRTSTIVLSC